MEILDLINSFEDYKELKGIYEQAVKNNITEFYYKNNLFLTAYAKYLLEYLESKFIIK